MSDHSTPTAWYDDPLEVDRYLEGQLDDPLEEATLAARRADVERDAALARRLEQRSRFLDGLSAAGARWRDGLEVPAGLESRVRFALRRDGAPVRAASPWRWAAAVAAVLVATLGMSFLGDRGDEAAAMPPEVIQAVDAARTQTGSAGGCDVDAASGPMQFPPVKDGSLRIWRCSEDGGRTVAKLYRPEDLPSIGYAAVADESVERGPDLGQTDLGDMVVYDIAYGRRRHYLAVTKVWLREMEHRHPGRASCRACHNRSREGQPNPHNIVQRSWRPGR